MKRTRLFLVLLLCLAMILPACSNTPIDQPSDTTAPTAADTTAYDVNSPYDPNGFLKDDLPEGLDFGNKEIKIFVGDYNGAYIDDMYVEEETGDRLSDTVCKIRRKVEDRLNVRLTYNWETYPYSKLSAFLSSVTNNIFSGDQAFDLLFDMNTFAYKQLEGEYFIDLSDTKYIDLEKPWYNQSILDIMPNNEIFFVSGDFSLANIKHAYGIYFNADLYEALGKTENLYDLVDSGNWTLEKMESLLVEVYHDVNGNGESDPGDRFGLTFGDTNKYLGFAPAFNVKIYTRTNDGYAFSLDSERAIDASIRTNALVNENINVLKALSNGQSSKFPEWQSASTGGNDISRVFTEGRSLFSASLISDAKTIVGEIDFTYGLLPYPKWDAQQENYQTSLQRSCYALIPTSTFNVDEASAVLEALSSESYRTLVPEYCEVMLKTRYAQDNDVARMFDLIGDSVVYDLGLLYSRGNPEAYFRKVIIDQVSLTSLIEPNREKLITEMDKVFAGPNSAE